MWEELGFYEGFALTWRAVLTKQGLAQDRASLHVKHLLDLISRFPRINPSASEPSAQDISHLLQQIRSKYRILCSTIAVKPSLRATGFLSQKDREGASTSECQTPKRSVWNIERVEDLSF